MIKIPAQTFDTRFFMIRFKAFIKQSSRSLVELSVQLEREDFHKILYNVYILNYNIAFVNSER